MRGGGGGLCVCNVGVAATIYKKENLEKSDIYNKKEQKREKVNIIVK